MLRRRRSAALSSLLVIALAACSTLGNPAATESRLAYEGDVRPPEDVAVVMGDGVIRFVKVNFRPLDTYRRVGPSLVAGGFLMIDVAPGENSFELCFSYSTPAGSPGPAGAYQPSYTYGATPNYGGGPNSNAGFCQETVAVTLKAEKGRIYQAQFKAQRGIRWTAEFVDVTDARKADVAARRKALAQYR